MADWTFIQDDELRRYVLTQDTARQEMWAKLFADDKLAPEEQEEMLQRYRGNDAMGDAEAAATPIGPELRDMVSDGDYDAIAAYLIQKGKDLVDGKEIY